MRFSSAVSLVSAWCAASPRSPGRDTGWPPPAVSGQAFVVAALAWCARLSQASSSRAGEKAVKRQQARYWAGAGELEKSR